MSNWQEWVVGIVVVACLLYVLLGIYRFFCKVRKKDNPCASCISGCELKHLLEQKKEECRKSKSASKKKCCG